MAASDQQAGAVERACADAVEAAVLEDRVGEVFDAMVVDLSGKRGAALVQVQEPAVLANADGQAELGTAVTVRLVEAESRGTVRFEIVLLRAARGMPRGRPRGIPALSLAADESARRSRRWETTAEERPGSTGQGGG